VNLLHKHLVFVFNLGDTSDLLDTETSALVYLWYRDNFDRMRLWTTFYGRFDYRRFHSLETSPAHGVPMPRSYLFAVAHDRKAASDGSNDHRDQHGYGQQTLDDHNNDPDDRCQDARKIEVGIESSRESSGGHFAETEKVYEHDVEPLTLKRTQIDDADERNGFYRE
jgi:hypothetical protein